MLQKETIMRYSAVVFFSFIFLFVACSDGAFEERSDGVTEESDASLVDTTQDEWEFQQDVVEPACPALTRAEYVRRIYSYGIEYLGKSCEDSSDTSFPDVTDEVLTSQIQCVMSWNAIFTYLDGDFSPNGRILRAELAVLLYQFFSASELMANLTPQTYHLPEDVDWSQWFATAVAGLTHWKVFQDDPFGPAEVVTECYFEEHLGYARTMGFSGITRADFFGRIFPVSGFTCPDITGDFQGHFSDVPPSHTYFYEIECAYSMNLINDNLGEFHPDQYLLRAEMAKLSVDFLGIENLTSEELSSLPEFDDLPNDLWFYEDVMNLLAKVLIPHTPIFRPSEYATYRSTEDIIVRCIDQGLCSQ